MIASFEELARAVRERRVLLFAGAGLSMSVGLPSWHELIDHMKRELGLEDVPHQSGWSYQTLSEYYRLKNGSLGPLRSWMDRTWSVCSDQVRQSEIHEIIVDLDFPLVYTTNYDNNLEIAYETHGRPYVKVANTSDIVNAERGLSQIVKFHGDFADDESLVLAETDYFRRLAFDSPLDIKFKADAMGRTLLFLGYSVSDLNIRMLLYRLWQMWQESGRERDRPPSYVFSPKQDPVQRMVLSQWGIRVLHERAEHPSDATLKFLRRLRDAVRNTPEPELS
ncbi:SIR2 family protein [Novosphingobium profundi]|nr:SIR2 family protein [Novosphingobium profundi]